GIKRGRLRFLSRLERWRRATGDILTKGFVVLVFGTGACRKQSLKVWDDEWIDDDRASGCEFADIGFEDIVHLGEIGARRIRRRADGFAEDAQSRSLQGLSVERAGITGRSATDPHRG